MVKLTNTLYLLLLLFAPLGYAVSRPWSAAVVEGLCLFLLLLYLLRSRGTEHPFLGAPGLLPLALLAGVPLLQLAPLPPFLLKLVSPNAWRLYADSVWVVRPGIWMPISVLPKATLAEFFRLASYVAFYLVTVQILADRQRLKKAGTILTIFAGVASVAAIFLLLFSKAPLSGIFGEWPMEVSAARAVQPFRSQYAGLLALLLPMVLAQFLASRPQVSYTSLRMKMTEVLRNPGAAPHIPTGLTLALLAAALLLSLSPAAIFSGLCALQVFLLLYLLRGRSRRKGGLLVLSSVTLVLVAALLGWGSMRQNPGPAANLSARAATERATVWRDSARIVGDYPLLGTGLGTFSDIYPRYKSVRTAGKRIHHVFNELLEFAAEGGAVVLILAAWFLFLLLRGTFSRWRGRHSRTVVYLYLGSLAGMAAVLVDSFVGLTFHRGATSLGFFFLAGLAAAAVSVPSKGGHDTSMQAPMPQGYLRLALLPVALLLLTDLLFNVGILAGRMQYAAAAGLAPAQAATAEGRETARRLTALAAGFDPLESRYRYALGDSGMAAGDLAAPLKQFGTALRLDPANAGYLQRLGLVYANLGKGKEAEKLLRAGVEDDRSNPERYKTIAFWLLKGGEVDKGLEEVRQGIFWGPENTRDFLTLMSLYGISDEKMREVLPERSYPLVVYGDYLAAAGKDKEAEKSYRTAIDLAGTEERPNPAVFQRVGEFFAGQGNFNEALAAIEAGIAIYPGNADFRFAAATYYEQLGITYRAIEEYRSALALDPHNDAARKRLSGLESEQL